MNYVSTKPKLSYAVNLMVSSTTNSVFVDIVRNRVDIEVNRYENPIIRFSQGLQTVPWHKYI